MNNYSFASENKCICSSFLFFSYLFEILIYDCDSEKDTCTRANGSHEISKDRESSNTASTESCSNWNISVELFDHRVFSHTINNQFLVNQLSQHLLSWPM